MASLIHVTIPILRHSLQQRACIMDSEMPYFLVWSLSSSAWCIMRYIYCISLSCLLSFYAIPIAIPFLISYEILHLLVSLHFFTAFSSDSYRIWKHAITIPNDIIHIIMYAQELVRAKGLKEWQTLLSFFIAINSNYYSHTDWYNYNYLHTIVQTSKLATWQKRLIYYSPAGLLVRHIMK